MALPFQGDIIIVGHPVVAVNGMAFGQQQPGQMETDEPSRSSDEDPLHIPRRPIRQPGTLDIYARRRAGVSEIRTSRPGRVGTMGIERGNILHGDLSKRPWKASLS